MTAAAPPRKARTRAARLRALIAEAEDAAYRRDLDSDGDHFVYLYAYLRKSVLEMADEMEAASKRKPKADDDKPEPPKPEPETRVGDADAAAQKTDAPAAQAAPAPDARAWLRQLAADPTPMAEPERAVDILTGTRETPAARDMDRGGDVPRETNPVDAHLPSRQASTIAEPDGFFAGPRGRHRLPRRRRMVRALLALLAVAAIVAALALALGARAHAQILSPAAMGTAGIARQTSPIGDPCSPFAGPSPSP